MQSDNSTPLPVPASPNPACQPKHTTISDAARHLLAQPVPGDKLGRTYAEMIASALIARAVAGDVQAMRLIFDITEEEPDSAEKEPVTVRVVYDRSPCSAEPEEGRSWSR